MNELIAEPEQRERGDLADPKKVGRRATIDKLRVQQRQKDLFFVLSSQEGRRFYWNLMAWCGLLEEPFTGNNTTFFNCGRGSVARKLFADLNEVAPEAYLMMVQEAKNEAEKA